MAHQLDWLLGGALFGFLLSQWLGMWVGSELSPSELNETSDEPLGLLRQAQEAVPRLAAVAVPEEAAEDPTKEESRTHRPVVPPEARSGSSLYKQMRGVRYDRSIIDLASWLSQHDHSLNLDDVFWLWDCACDGSGVTKIETNTLRYVLATYPIQDSARDDLMKRIDESESGVHAKNK